MVHTVVDDLRFSETDNKVTLGILGLDYFLAHWTLNTCTQALRALYTTATLQG